MSAQVGESRLIPEWSVGDRLRKVRRVTGYGQAEFAKQLGENAKTYAAWELDTSAPRNIVALAKKIELITGVPAAWVLGLDAIQPATEAATAGSNGRYDSDNGVVVRLLPQLNRHRENTADATIVRIGEDSRLAS